MKAIVQSVYGTAPEEVLRVADVPAPMPEYDEVLVRVRASSVDRGTWHVMAERTVDLDAFRQLIDAGGVVPAVERTYQLYETAAAIRHLLDGRARGKVAITV